MIVAVQYNPVTEVMKYRPCIDLSRHVNWFIAASSNQLDHLSISQELIHPGDFMKSIDLENQFFHVRLAPRMRKYLGFAVPAADGSMQYFQFEVMAYRVKPTVTVVTRLLRPIKAYVQTLGIWFSIYVDNGRIAASSAQCCTEQTSFLLLVLQLAGRLEDSVDEDVLDPFHLPVSPRLYHRFSGDAVLHHPGEVGRHLPLHVLPPRHRSGSAAGHGEGGGARPRKA
jgi:hypothetical protein